MPKKDGYIETKNSNGFPAGRKPPSEMNRPAGSDQPMSNKPVASRPIRLGS